MNRLQDYALYDISWNLSPEHAVTMYLEWGNNDWHSEYPPVRSKEDVSEYESVHGKWRGISEPTPAIKSWLRHELGQ